MQLCSDVVMQKFLESEIKFSEDNLLQEDSSETFIYPQEISVVNCRWRLWFQWPYETNLYDFMCIKPC